MSAAATADAKMTAIGAVEDTGRGRGSDSGSDCCYCRSRGDSNWRCERHGKRQWPWQLVSAATAEAEGTAGTAIDAVEDMDRGSGSGSGSW